MVSLKNFFTSFNIMKNVRFLLNPKKKKFDDQVKCKVLLL